MPQEALEAFRQSDAEGAPAGGSSRRWIVIAVTAALVVFGLGFMAWGSLASLGGSTEAEGLGDEERPDSGDTDTEQGEDTPGSVTTESVPSSEAPMPDVVGSSIEDAEATLDQLGLTVEVIEDATLTRPAGQVAHQSITVGALVSEGETVTLTVSTGEGVGLVPYVIGMSEVQALDVLDKAGFTDVRVVSIPDNETPAGQVVRTNPEPGSDHDPDRTFVVFVSKGSGAIAEVPDVVGLTQAEAVAALIDADLRFSIEFVDLADESPAAGRVVEQDPEAGSERPSGFTVELRIGR